jgi:hypothetical protein
VVIDTESEFIRRTIQILKIPLMSKNRAAEVEICLDDLKKRKMQERIHSAKLKNWIWKKDNENIC